MDMIEAIYCRQSIGRVKPESVPHQDIEALLGAAVQAPNHFGVRPWRFVVLVGEARRQLGDVMAAAFQTRFPNADASALDRERAKPLRAPLIIAVGADPPADPRVQDIENICAAAAACENILLAAVELGLAGHWRTGDAAGDPEIKHFLGFSPAQHVIGFLYLGYPEVWPEARERPSFRDRVDWRQ
jgi:nitroreductase